MRRYPKGHRRILLFSIVFLKTVTVSILVSTAQTAKFAVQSKFGPVQMDFVFFAVSQIFSGPEYGIR